MSRSEQLGKENVLKLIVNFSIPAIIGMLVNALYNVVDKIYIGQGVGSLGLAGITIGFPIMNVLMAFSMLIGIGGNSLMSIWLGEGRKDEAENILGNVVVLLICIALTLTVFGLLFLDPLLMAFGADSEVLPYARDYVSIILMGAIFQFIGFGLNHFMRGEGNPKMAMGSMLLGAILNIVLDPIFIFAFNMGIKGAALATIISQAAAAAWGLNYFLRGNSLLKIKREYLRLNWSVVKRIVTLGSAPFAMQIASSTLTIILNNGLLQYGGNLAISSMGIVNALIMLILMPVFGINQGAQPIIGYNYGAKQYDRVKEALKYAILGETMVVTLGFIAIQLFSKDLIKLFNKNDQELIDMASYALKTFTFAFPVVGFQIASSNYFQAVGKPKYSMFLSLSRQVILLIPLILVLPRFYGLDGIFMAGPISDITSSALAGFFIFFEIRRLNDEEKENALAPSVQCE